jgi:hypothetical protein
VPFRHPRRLRLSAVRMVEGGMRPAAVARQLGVNPVTVYAWLHADAPHLVSATTSRCWRCRAQDTPPDLGAYAHLLGLYLGDGWIGRMGNGTFFLSICCDDAWPGLAAECSDVLLTVLARSTCRVRRKGSHEVKAYSNHWPCLLPQHGPGKKHDRPIVLEPWQRAVVDEHPGKLLRGLFHSDGWRGENVAVHRSGDTVVRYRYPRYEFTNYSADIRRLCTDALDRLEIA